MMEFVTLYFPLLEVYRRKRSMQRSTNVETATVASNFIAEQDASNKHGALRKNSLYSMQALENTIKVDPAELLRFAATKEFTGENIIFLIRVRDWKAHWERSIRGGSMSLEIKRGLYNDAAEIFSQNVSLQTSQFPINVEHRVYRDLEVIFQKPRQVDQTEDVISPFSDHAQDAPSSWLSSIRVPSSEHIVPLSSSQEIPEAFSELIFDPAEASIKYMVLTNTWYRYVSCLI